MKFANLRMKNKLILLLILPLAGIIYFSISLTAALFVAAVIFAYLASLSITRPLAGVVKPETSP